MFRKKCHHHGPKKKKTERVAGKRKGMFM